MSVKYIANTTGKTVYITPMGVPSAMRDTAVPTGSGIIYTADSARIAYYTAYVTALGLDQTDSATGGISYSVINDVDNTEVWKWQENIGLEIQAVKDISNTAPVSPLSGDKYIVGTSPTGAFATKSKYIAEYTGSSWTFTAPSAGSKFYVESMYCEYFYNGTIWTTGLPVLATSSPVNAVAATGTLTVSGVVLNGETVTVGDDTYEFASDDELTVAEGNIAVDITDYTTKAQGTLTLAVQPTAGDTFVLGSKTYTYTADGTADADGEIDVGIDLADAQSNTVAAINGTDANNDPHPLVTAGAFADNASVITALVGGVAGNSIASTEIFTSGSNVFDAATLGTTTAGTDCTAANAILALVDADVGTTYILADGAGDTVTATALTKGVAGNAIDTTETMSNGAFGAATLAGGVNGTVGAAATLKYDTNYLYICKSDNTISDANWRRIALGSAY